jgi:hypothetical protein
MKISITLIFTAILLISCENISEPNDGTFDGDIPYGMWVYSENDDSISIYYASNQFEKDKSGFAIEEENIFIERTSGWCATPPLSFYNVEGQWDVFDDHTLKITGAHWMGSDYIRLMEIVSLNKFELKVLFRSLPDSSHLLKKLVDIP